MIQLRVLVDNVRSLHNVGSFFRTADGLGIEKLYLTGGTGYPHPDQPWRRDHLTLSKTALGAEKSVDWEYHVDPLVVISKLKSTGWLIASLEDTPQAIPLNDWTPVNQKIVIIVGSEREGVGPELLAQSDVVLKIPMVGTKESFNVSVAFGIAAFWLKKLPEKS